MKDEPLTPEELAALEPYEDAIIAGESIDGIVGTNLFRIKYQHTDPRWPKESPTPSPKSSVRITSTRDFNLHQG
jgi:hypothetical protein